MDSLLVADDLTGACDAAVHFAMRGLRPTVVRLPGHPYSGVARVLACSTESRDMTPEQIRQALLDVAAELKDLPPGRIFKKIDSTLRGNVGMEVVAARDAFECDAAVVCPAFPAMRRVVEHGTLYAPAFTPVDIAERLREQSGEACCHVRPEDLAATLASGARLISVDAATDADLDHIAADLASGADFSLRTGSPAGAPAAGRMPPPDCGVGRRVLWAGSAGLASALARRIAGTETPPTSPLARGPVVFCIGSDHAVTQMQQAVLIAARPCTVVVVLPIPRGRITPDEVRTYISVARPAALVVSGGDTASLVFHAIGARAIHLCAEIVPGVPYGILRGGLFDGLPVVTKSGGFGDRDTLVNVADFFHAPI